MLLRAGRDDPSGCGTRWPACSRANLLLGGWLSLLLVAGAPFAVRVMGGSGYPGASTVLRILGAGVVGDVHRGVLADDAPLRSRVPPTDRHGRRDDRVLAIVGCAILIPTHGARGAAIVTVSLEALLACTYAGTLARTHPRLRPPLARTARIALALALAFAAALAVPVSSLGAAADRNRDARDRRDRAAAVSGRAASRRCEPVPT